MTHLLIENGADVNARMSERENRPDVRRDVRPHRNNQFDAAARSRFVRAIERRNDGNRFRVENGSSRCGIFFERRAEVGRVRKVENRRKQLIVFVRLVRKLLVANQILV